jgi:DNA-binding response OmpR family regulator
VEDHHKIEGFNRGGDDYITKPFNIQEVIARVGAIIRRTKHQSATLSYRDIVIDLDQHAVKINEKLVELTKREFDLLVVMIRNKNIVLTRETLLAEVWGDDDFLQERTVDVAMKRLKEKIDPTKTKEYIGTVRGVGYKLC